MRCRECGAELATRACKDCGKANLEEALYCMYCGKKLDGKGDETEDFDLDSRILCPDGNCTGIIENGRCTVCGRPYQ